MSKAEIKYAVVKILKAHENAILTADTKQEEDMARTITFEELHKFYMMHRHLTEKNTGLKSMEGMSIQTIDFVK
jgi:hypothetical protein